MRVVRVQGKGKVSTEPDICILSFEVEEQTEEYGDCLSNLNQRTEQLRQGLRSGGINVHDVKTTDFNIRVENEYSQGRNIFVGYRGSHCLRMELPIDKDLLNKVLDKIIEARSGAEISIAFSVKDKESLKKETLQEAVRVAKTNARTLADAAGLKLGKLQQLDYGWTEVRIYEQESVMAYEAPSRATHRIDIEPEEVTAHDSVTLVYEIED